MSWIPLLAFVFFIRLPQAPVAASASVEGVIIRLGTAEPVARAQVLLSGAGGGPGGSLRAVTDANGRFSLKGVTPGRYRVFATRDGYIRAEYGQRAAGSAGKIIALAAGQEMKDLTLTLTPTATISGRVYNRDGDPVVNATVEALTWRFVNGQRVLVTQQSARSNDLGEYRLYWLNPGKYVVSARPLEAPRSDGNSITMEAAPGIPVASVGGLAAGVVRVNANSASAMGLVQSDEIGLPVYFPGTTDAAAASPIDLRPGAVYSGLDMNIMYVRAVHVRGHITNSVTGRAPRTGQVMLVSRGRVGGVSQRNTGMNPAGEFDFEGVPPGSYEIVSVTNEPSIPGVAGRLMARIPIEVGNADLNNIPVVLQPGFTLAGRLLIDGQPPAETQNARSVTVGLRADFATPGPAFPPSGGNVAFSDGTFSFLGANPGTYQIMVNNLPPNAYIKSATLGGTDVLYNGVRIDGPPGGVLDIQISRNSGTFEATVFEDSRDAAGNARVVLVPELSRRQRVELYRTAVSDDAGRVRLQGVVPGDYTVYAWDASVEPGAWQDPDFLRAYEDRGKPVRILENGVSSGELRVIPPAQ